MQEMKPPVDGAPLFREFVSGRSQQEIEQKLNRSMADAESKGYTFVRRVPKIGRNDPCPCSSGRKFKKCCMQMAI